MTPDIFYTTAIQFLSGEPDGASRDAFERLLREDAGLRLQFNTIRIDTYLAGELSEPELKAFEVQFRDDAELRRKVELHRKVRSGLKSSEIEKLRSELIQLYPQIPPGELLLVHRRPWRTYLAVAATILLIVFAGWNFWFSHTDPGHLYVQHFQPYPMLIGERGDVSAIESAKQYYIDGNYASAATGFERAADNAQIMFYAGVAYLAAGDVEKSISILEDLTEDFNFGDHARWYLALAFLNQPDLDAAERTLISIGEDNTSEYQQAARKLLRKLR